MSLRTGEFAQTFIVALDVLEREREVHEIVRLFSPMARITTAATRRTGVELTGEVGARQFWREYRSCFGEVHTEFNEVTTNDRCAGLFWTTRGTRPDGKPVEYSGATLIAYEDDGLIIEFDSFHDTRDLALTAAPDVRPERPAHA